MHIILIVVEVSDFPVGQEGLALDNNERQTPEVVLGADEEYKPKSVTKVSARQRPQKVSENAETQRSQAAAGGEILKQQTASESGEARRSQATEGSAGRQRSQGVSDFNERRKKADWVVKMATILSLAAWLVAFAVWIVLDSASPEKTTFFTQFFGASVRSYWDTSLLPVAFALLVVSLCTCIIAFVFNMLRMRRKTDKYRKSIIIIGAITIAGIIFFVIRFWL